MTQRVALSAVAEFKEMDSAKGGVIRLAWSSDGRWLALAAQAGGVTILNAETQQVIRTIGPHAGAVSAFALDRKAERIMTAASDGSISLWEVSTGDKADFPFPEQKSAVHTIEWTDEEAYAITCSFEHLQALDGLCLLSGWTPEMEHHVNRSAGFRAVACSHRSTFLLAAAADGGAVLRLISLLNADVLATVRMKEPIHALAWSPATDLLAADTGARILLFHATQEGFSGRRETLADKSSKGRMISFSSDGNILACCNDRVVNFWSIPERKLVAVVDDTTEPADGSRSISGIVFHPIHPNRAAMVLESGTFCFIDLAKVI